MGPEVRTALLLVGIVFCLGFTAMTLAAAPVLALISRLPLDDL